MSAKTKPTRKRPPKKGSSVYRISAIITAAKKAGLPKDAAMFAAVLVEIQKLEIRMDEMEKQITKITKKNKI